MNENTVLKSYSMATKIRDVIKGVCLTKPNMKIFKGMTQSIFVSGTCIHYGVVQNVYMQTYLWAIARYWRVQIYFGYIRLSSAICNTK